MLDGLSLPFICAASGFVKATPDECLKILLCHPLLQEEEKILWLWLATQSANNESFTCSYNYEQISLAMKLSTRKIHRILTRLRTMGVLIADIPIYYGKLTPEMVHKVHTFKLILPPKYIFKPKDVKGLVLPLVKRGINLNLIRKFK